MRIGDEAEAVAGGALLRLEGGEAEDRLLGEIVGGAEANGHAIADEELQGRGGGGVLRDEIAPEAEVICGGDGFRAGSELGDESEAGVAGRSAGGAGEAITQGEGVESFVDGGGAGGGIAGARDEAQRAAFICPDAAIVPAIDARASKAGP